MAIAKDGSIVPSNSMEHTPTNLSYEPPFDVPIGTSMGWPQVPTGLSVFVSEWPPCVSGVEWG